MRVFIAHKKDDTDEHINGVIARFKQRFTKHVYDFTLGRDDFAAAAKSKGGWNGWTASISAPGYGSTSPRFELIVATQTNVGKATADIIRHALDRGVRVLVEVVETEGSSDEMPAAHTNFKLVKAIEESGSVGKNGKASWQDGWRLVT